MKELKPIHEKIDIDGPYNITSKYARSYGSNIWGITTWGNLLLYLERDISTIQDLLDIDGYTNREISEIEADKNAIGYLYMSRFNPGKWSRYFQRTVLKNCTIFS